MSSPGITPSNFVDLKGRRFGRWKILRRAPRTAVGQRARWVCRCTCGTIKVVYGYSLRLGDSTSCGCYGKERRLAALTTHGMCRSPTYRTWTYMLARCLNMNVKAFPGYGGRGIRVCNRWMKFENFLADMGERPEGMQIDRINNNAGYSKKNCRWVDSKTNNRNRRDTVYLTHGGTKMSLQDWADKRGIPAERIRLRLRRGYPVSEAISRKLFTFRQGKRRAA